MGQYTTQLASLTFYLIANDIQSLFKHLTELYDVQVNIAK